MSADTRAMRARVAGLTARGADPGRVEAAQAELKVQHIREQVAKWPPLTAEQRSALAVLLLAEDGRA